MEQELNRINVDFMVKPNMIPLSIGLIALGVVCLVIGSAVANGIGNLFSGGRILVVVICGAFIGLGGWIACSIPFARRRIPISLAAEGIEFRNGKVIPWEHISSIAKGPEFLASGSYYREQTDIDLKTGDKISLTTDWIENFSEVHKYLTGRPEFIATERYAVNPTPASAQTVSPSTAVLPRMSDQVEAATHSTDQRVKPLSELPSINVEISLFEDFGAFIGTAVILGMGVVLCGLPFFVRPKGAPFPMSMTVPFVLVGIGLIVLGCYMPSMIRKKRKIIPRSFSSDGIGLRDGSIIQWDKVSRINDAVGTRSNGSGYTRSFRESNIQLRDGRGLKVSSDAVSNFDDLHAYLAKLPQYEGN